jgi:hypothetical protein
MIYIYISSIIKIIRGGMVAWKNNTREKHLQLNYSDSFIFPLKRKDGSLRNVRIHLNGIFFLVPPSPSHTPTDVSVKSIVFTPAEL